MQVHNTAPACTDLVSFVKYTNFPYCIKSSINVTCVALFMHRSGPLRDKTSASLAHKKPSNRASRIYVQLQFGPAATSGVRSIQSEHTVKKETVITACNLLQWSLRRLSLYSAFILTWKDVKFWRCSMLDATLFLSPMSVSNHINKKVSADRTYQ